MIRRLTILVVCALGAVLFAAPAADASYFHYRKDGTSWDGRIKLVCGYQCESGERRAGSGNGGQDGCQWGNWIPNGTYNVEFHADNYPGSLIRGRVWKLNDFYCPSNGNTRTELFVHTEETQGQQQTCDPYDEQWCWDGDGDYQSLGCIKVARRPVYADGYSDVGWLDHLHHATSPVTSVNVTTW